MKKLVVLLVLVGVVNVVWAEGPVYFADANLKAAVEAELGISDPNATDMLGLTELDDDYSGIVDLTGLEYATNISQLILQYNFIDSNDLTPLSGLNSLTQLLLTGNNITDISALSGLTNMMTLWLGGNDISDISALSNMTIMIQLLLYSNDINDISALSNMTNMTQLWLAGNNISDISVLSSIVKLQNIDLLSNNISDLSALTGLMNLTYMRLSSNPLDQLAYCVYLPLIQDNNPGINLTYDPGECTLNCFNTRLEGTWYWRGLSTQKNGQPDDFGYDNAVFDFNSNGFFTGTMTDQDGSSWDENGISQLAEDGSINLLFNKNKGVLNAPINVSRDVMISNSEYPEEVFIDILVKAGESYATSDLEGVWYSRKLQVPQNGYPDNFGYDIGIYTFQNDGSFQGEWITETGSTGTETGTASVEPNGIVNITFDGSPPLEVVAAMNARKNLFIYNFTDNEVSEESHAIEIMVKKGTSYSLSDIVGTWFSRSIGTQMNGQPDNFGYDTLVITIQEDGSFMLIVTGTTSEEDGGELFYSTGTASIDSNGVVSLYVPSESFELNPVLSAGKDVMINNYLDPGNEIGIEIFVKKESLPGDLNFDGKVDLRDFAIFANNWLNGVE